MILTGRHFEEASEHLVALLDGKDATVVGTTYKTIQDTVQKVIDSGYFSRPLHAVCDTVEDHFEDDAPINGNASCIRYNLFLAQSI